MMKKEKHFRPITSDSSTTGHINISIEIMNNKKQIPSLLNNENETIIHSIYKTIGQVKYTTLNLALYTSTQYHKLKSYHLEQFCFYKSKIM